MGLILSLDSTTVYCSVAVHRNGELLFNEVSTEPRTAATRLAVMIKNVLLQSGFSRNDLEAIAISSGPGSYTGLRIATSTAKGLCFALRIPLIAVDSLSVLTNQLIGKVKTDLFCPMLDARRMEVYCALLNSNREFIKPIESLVLTEKAFQTELASSRIMFFGDGAEKFKSLTNHNNATFVDSIHPSAVDLGYLAYDKFCNKEFENIELFEPYYLKNFVIKK